MGQKCFINNSNKNAVLNDEFATFTFIILIYLIYCRHFFEESLLKYLNFFFFGKKMSNIMDSCRYKKMDEVLNKITLYN